MTPPIKPGTARRFGLRQRPRYRIYLDGTRISEETARRFRDAFAAELRKARSRR